MWQNIDPFGPHQFDNQKILHHNQIFLDAISEKNIKPIVFELSPSDVCNQECPYCVSKGYRGGRHMLNVSDMHEIIGQIATLAKAVTFVGGGEPLSNPNTVNAIKYAKSLNLDVGLITNGTLIKPEDYDILLSSCTFIRISLDTTNPTNYQLNRGAQKGHLMRVLSNLHKLAVNKRHSRYPCTLGSQIVWVSQTNSEIEEAIASCKAAGVDFVQIRPVDFAPSHGFIPNWEVYSDFTSFFTTLIEKYSTDEFRVIPSWKKFSDAMNEKDHGRFYIGCPGGNFTCSIGADAKVYFCCTNLGNPDFAIGDLKNESLDSILENRKRQELIRNCNFVGCQAFCRNHEINKLFHNFKEMKAQDQLVAIEQITTQPLPLHVNFL